MGQRLVFEVTRGTKANKRVICGLYYHWSAYTITAMYEGKAMIDGLKKRGYSETMSDQDTIKMILDILNHDCIHKWNNPITGEAIETRGGLADNTRGKFDWLKDDPSIENKVSRSVGLLGVGEEALKSFKDWAEDIEEFNIDEHYFTIDGLIGYYTLDDIRSFDENIIWDDIPDYEFPFDFPLGYTLFTKVNELIKWFTEKQNENGWILGKYVDEDIPMIVTITQ